MRGIDSSRPTRNQRRRALRSSVRCHEIRSGWLTLAAFGALSIGCTIETGTKFPDGGQLPDASVDAMVGMDSAIALPPPTIDSCTAAGMGATIGMTCTGDSPCDDGCFCNGVEVCNGGQCAAAENVMPCDDGIDCTVDVCLEEANHCFRDPQNQDCSDGLACNGVEVCDFVNGCSPSAPLYCNDEDSCTIDLCDDGVGCMFLARDLDGDGFVDGRCGGMDCDDDPRFGTEIYPGAPEDCMNRRDDDCDGSRDFVDLDCVPTNDTCATAQMLPGAGTYSGATRALVNDYTLGCSTSSGPDAVYLFSLTDPMNVTATISGGGSNSAVSIRTFAECDTGPDIRCSRGTPPNTQARSLPAGDYAIIVQTTSALPFDLSLQIEPPTPDPPGDTCVAAIDVTAAPGIANLPDMQQDAPPSCNSTFGTYRDAYFFFDLTDVQDVTVTTRADGSTLYASLSTTCADIATELRCWSGSGDQVQTWRSLPAGRYYVVTSTTRTTGIATTTVLIEPPTPIPPNDRCSGRIMIANGTARNDTTVDFEDDESGGSCAGASRPDAFYTFTLAARSTVIISVTDDDGGSSRFYLSLKDGCAGADVPGGCISQSGTATLNLALDPGTYILMIESPSTDTSDYNLFMSVFPA